MAKFVAGDVVVVRFPQTDLASGQRRPAPVVADVGRGDFVLCQITTRHHGDGSSISPGASDLA
ncbi:MAG TPA: hypothetical protein VH253_03990 [Phycisphaerae bacterium]|nr:hypothetical protein [Phycisphaerae bacterium]